MYCLGSFIKVFLVRYCVMGKCARRPGGWLRRPSGGRAGSTELLGVTGLWVTGLAAQSCSCRLKAFCMQAVHSSSCVSPVPLVLQKLGHLQKQSRAEGLPLGCC